MSYPTRAAAFASLREFNVETRKLHIIVSFWSELYGGVRYARVYTGKKAKP